MATVVGAVQLLSGSGSSATPPADRARSAADATLAKLPLRFVENRGQVDRRARFYLPGEHTSVYFTAGGLRMSLAGRGLVAQRYGLGLALLVLAPARDQSAARRRPP